MKIKDIREELKVNYHVYIMERCDCGDNVRHNNGGNYHDMLCFKRGAKDNLYLSHRTTSENSKWSGWQLVKDFISLEDEIKEYIWR